MVNYSPSHSVPSRAREAFSAWQADLATNALDADAHFSALITQYGRSAAIPRLRPFAGLVSSRLDELSRITNRDENLPRLQRFDNIGNRVEAVCFHPDYHAIGRDVYATGLVGLYATPGREFETLSFVYLLGQNGEGGHACPLACTAGLTKVLRATLDDPPAAEGSGGLGHDRARDWLDKVYDPNYDTHIHGAQFLTEVQGGSDVGSNALSAELHGDRWRLSGEKWFCSVADAQLFVVTARPQDAGPGTQGLGAFVVPRMLDNGHVNHFELRRLKVKLGTRSMASAEIDFRGAEAWRVGDFRRTVEVVLNTSRLYNAVVAAGVLQRAWREADAYARVRAAFGSPIREFPVVRRILARLFTEAAAARASSFYLADLADSLARGESSPEALGAWRMLVNLNKMWTALTCPAGVRDAIEVLGGNGAIEEFSVLPRLLRDSIVVEAWEGGHGVLCAQLLRDSQRLRLHEPMFAWLSRAIPGTRLAAIRARWEAVIARPDAAWVFRDLVDDLRIEVQAGLLAGEGNVKSSAAAEHLLASRRDPMGDAGLIERVRVLLEP